MPTYDYRCNACGKDNVVRYVRMSERNDQKCECGALLEKKMSAGQPPVFRGVQATCSMGAQRLPDTSLTTDPR